MLKSLALVVLNSCLLIKMNTFKINTIYRNNICDLDWKKIVHTITQAVLV